MPQEFTMPKLGLTMTDGTIREWLVADGTMVEVGQPVLVIETDKVETEVEAREAGVLSRTGLVGENYECGQVIGYLLADGEQGSAPPPDTAPASPATPDSSIAASAPAAAQEAAPMASTQAATAVMDRPAPAGADVAARGQLHRILASPRARATARDLNVELAHISGTGPNRRIIHDDVVAFSTTVADNPAATTLVVADAAARGERDRILASPRARATARDLNVELAHIAGTGPEGRIVHDDVVAAAAATRAPSAAAPAQQPAVVSPGRPQSQSVAATPVPAASAMAPGVSATGGARMLAELLGVDLRAVPASTGNRVSREDVATWVRAQLAGPPEEAAPAPAADRAEVPLLQEPSSVIPFRGMRGVIAERMHASLTEMAQLTLSVNADMSAVNTERDRRKQAQLAVPGYTAWVVAAASRALIDHPYVNSQVTAEGVAILPEIHLGVAVALDEGLIVPVVSNAANRPVEELHSTVADLAARARDGKLKLHELEGGTFSVTALGMYGVDMFTPVINPPNAAILGVGRLRTETAWHDGVPSPKTVMTLSLTWDHRAFDGAPAAEFAQSIVRYLEDPTQLIE